MANKLSFILPLLCLALLQCAWGKSISNDASIKELEIELEDLREELDERLEEIKDEIQPLTGNEAPLVDPVVPPVSPAPAKSSVQDNDLFEDDDFWSDESLERKDTITIQKDVFQPTNNVDLFQPLKPFNTLDQADPFSSFLSGNQAPLKTEDPFSSFFSGNQAPLETADPFSSFLSGNQAPLETADPFSYISSGKLPSSMEFFGFADPEPKRGSDQLFLTSQSLLGIKTPADLPFLTEPGLEDNTDNNLLFQRAALFKQTDMSTFGSLTDLKTYRVPNYLSQIEANQMVKSVVQDLGSRAIKGEPFLLQAYVFPQKMTEAEKDQVQFLLDNIDLLM